MNGQKTVFATEDTPLNLLAINGSDKKFPVRRVYCVGRNYAEHAKEMGVDPKASPPIFFMKPGDCVVLASADNPCDIPYPPKTNNLHHEIELVIAIKEGGKNLSTADAKNVIFGYGVGVDLTRRDLQADAKKKGQPWELAKAFDQSAPMSPLYEMNGVLDQGRIWLSVDGSMRQEGDIKEMIWGVAEIVSILSQYYQLKSGDLIFTGTPEGVGPLNIGEHVEGGVDGVGGVAFKISSPD